MALIALPLVLGALVMPDISGSFARGAAEEWGHGSYTIEIFVDRDGVVLECRVLAPALAEARAGTFCDRLIGRDAGAGAVGPDGEMIAGDITLSRVTGDGRLPDHQRTAQIEFMVPSIADGRDRVEVNFLIAVDETGRLLQCDAQSTRDAAYSAAACEQAGALVFAARTGSDGQPIRYVTDLAVDFVREAPAL